ncbi:MAG: hypothetical protein R3E88_01050 [Myxococcota bacterium]
MARIHEASGLEPQRRHEQRGRRRDALAGEQPPSGELAAQRREEAKVVGREAHIERRLPAEAVRQRDALARRRRARDARRDHCERGGGERRARARPLDERGGGERGAERNREEHHHAPVRAGLRGAQPQRARERVREQRDEGEGVGDDEAARCAAQHERRHRDREHGVAQRARNVAEREREVGPPGIGEGLGPRAHVVGRREHAREHERGDADAVERARVQRRGARERARRERGACEHRDRSGGEDAGQQEYTRSAQADRARAAQGRVQERARGGRARIAKREQQGRGQQHEPLHHLADPQHAPGDPERAQARIVDGEEGERGDRARGGRAHTEAELAHEQHEHAREHEVRRDDRAVVVDAERVEPEHVGDRGDAVLPRRHRVERRDRREPFRRERGVVEREGRLRMALLPECAVEEVEVVAARREEAERERAERGADRECGERGGALARVAPARGRPREAPALRDEERREEPGEERARDPGRGARHHARVHGDGPGGERLDGELDRDPEPVHRRSPPRGAAAARGRRPGARRAYRPRRAPNRR